jgi:hypothetical protein
MKPYTGFNGDAGAARLGLARLVDYCTFLTGNGLWNNGMYANRPMRGKPTTSVHATGRAVDLSWRKTPATKTRPARGFGTYPKAKQFIDFLVTHQDALMLELVLDYHPGPHGQGWRCDRQTWVQYDRPTIGGAPGGDWFHLEISPRQANNPAFYDQAFRDIFTAGS